MHPHDAVGGVSDNGWLEPDDDPFTFYSNRYPRRSIDLLGVGATLAQDLSDALHLDLVIGHETSDRNLDGAPGAPIRVNQFIFTDKIGRASCRERVCQYVEISVVAAPLKKKKKYRKYYNKI